ncbi:MAG: protein-L-isoaspartate(D-aspartate) O-methyltransferase [Bacteroidales bacterium]|nr:protein-L-isoaspartate(D-aspartate) O-methyltransferase [Bacteroidales bacterium]
MNQKYKLIRNNLVISSFLVLSFLLISCKSKSQPGKSLTDQRNEMVNTQIVARGITDSKVLKAMRKVERHLFVPVEFRDMAYIDRPLLIGYGQTISQPYIVAFMTEVLNLKKEDRVLEVGTGSGYQAAILAEICDSVFSIEIVEELGLQAKELLSDLGYRNILVITGDGYLGWKEKSPFDAIIVTCAPTGIPIPLQEQLAEGGKMIIPVGERYAQELVLLTKKNGKLVRKEVLPVRFVPMVDENGKLY